jgi:AraC family transcriptional regulator
VHRDQVEHAREVLAFRFCERLSLADIARLARVSVFHLCRVLRRLTGLALHEYRTELRLRHALGPLEEARPDLTQIALDVGFSSHSHFTETFRREFGLTPSAFIRDRRNGKRSPATPAPARRTPTAGGRRG